MPKIVNHEKLKVKVAEAAWRVLRREGLEGATVRKIAEEAGISPGSMRHYFSTQSDLIYYSMNLVSERVKKRIQNLKFTGNPSHDACLLLFEFLPIDEEKRAEMEVWLIFNMKALSDPTLQELVDKVYLETKQGIAFIIDALIQHGIARENMNRDVEIQVLYALLDGLTLQGIMKPEIVTPEFIKRTINHHIESLCIKRAE
ncbi:TetR/AcrR family transcriptional regulator [Bacillus sp. 31A1R]|uniref:TetR/AcrR family transcriptional regulator n=1 Tax=Robertmurraya mangrovi TaxID=3098077 RepID=A0ABU5IWA8_9BACI|nr:TetR/AcrR family transcriptional regulator [Bacillus sp. 31A1R]MDZ5471420.1 TetR/AcrR family transcriptional regulator [Bacillus sp. 31A1R]